MTPFFSNCGFEEGNPKGLAHVKFAAPKTNEPDDSRATPPERTDSVPSNGATSSPALPFQPSGTCSPREVVLSFPHASVAQRTEQGFPKPLVAGSSPAGGALAAESTACVTTQTQAVFCSGADRQATGLSAAFLWSRSIFSICRGVPLRSPDGRRKAVPLPRIIEKIRHETLKCLGFDTAPSGTPAQPTAKENTKK